MRSKIVPLFCLLNVHLSCHCQVSVHGLRALELLLESYRFFPTLQTLVQTQSLSKLKEKTPLVRRAMDSCSMGQLPKYGSDMIQTSNKNVSIGHNQKLARLYECLSQIG